MGTHTANILQSIGVVAFWAMAWQVLSQALRPARQPLFSRFAGGMVALGLALVFAAAALEWRALVAIGQTICYLGIATYVLREAVNLRYRRRQARRRRRMLQAQAERARNIARGEDDGWTER
jgi:hypothetical protein